MSFSFGIAPSQPEAAPEAPSVGSSSSSAAAPSVSFGSIAPQPSSGFGFASQQPPAMSPFGSTGGLFGGTNSANAAAGTGGLFGGTNGANAAAGTGGLFGGANAAAGTGGLFGGTNSTNAAAGTNGLFGASAVSATGSGFGFSSQPSMSLFGSTTNATNNAGFGASGGFESAVPLPSTSSPAPIFGCFLPQPSAAMSAFGPFASQSLYDSAPAPPTKPGAPTTPTEKPDAVAESHSSTRCTGVKFPSQKNKTYRFELAVKDEKLTIWLEDSTTKAQWKSKPLSMEDCIPKDKAIPMATLEDYVECFKKCLSSADPTHAKDKDLVKFSSKSDDDVFQLELTVRVQLSSRVLTPKYQFTLYALDLDPIDLLTSRIRDQEDEVESLRAELTQLKTSGGRATVSGLQPVYFQADVFDSVDSGRRLTWNVRSFDIFNKHGFQLKSPDTIQATFSGVYVVLLTIKHTTVSNMFTSAFQPAVRVNAFKLLKNGEAIASNSDASPNGNVMTSTMQRIVSLQRSDELSVLNSGNGYIKAESSVIIYMIR